MAKATNYDEESVTDEKKEAAADFLLQWLGTPSEFAENTGDEWEPVIREVLKALDEASE